MFSFSPVNRMDGPMSCATMYGGTWRFGKCPAIEKARVTAGLMCAPEMWPVAKIATITARPNESPTPRWVTAPPETSLITAAPGPAKTSRNVPTASAT